MASFEIARLAPGQQRGALAALTRAFYDDPMFNWFQPDPLRQMHLVRHFMRTPLVDSAKNGEVWVALDHGWVYGVAGWLKPGDHHSSTAREIAKFAVGAPAVFYAWRRVMGALRLYRASEKAHPKFDHWYLAVLGVDPLLQGKGAGTALLEPVLSRADEAGLPAYVETQKESNVVWYGRSGFEVVEELHAIPGGPPIWTLLREPRSR